MIPLGIEFTGCAGIYAVKLPRYYFRPQKTRCQPMPENPKVSVVIPVYNEAGVIERTHFALAAVLDELPYDFSVYYIDDGSSDGTDAILEKLASADRRIQPLLLSRNFGHQAALTAGL